MLSSVLFGHDIKFLSFCVISSRVSDKSPSLWVCSCSSQGFLFGKAGEILTKRLRYMVFRSMLRQVCLLMCRTPHLGPMDSGSGGIVWLFGAPPALLFPRSLLTDADKPLPRCRLRGPAVTLSLCVLCLSSHRQSRQRDIQYPSSLSFFPSLPWETQDTCVSSYQVTLFLPFFSANQNLSPWPISSLPSFFAGARLVY